MRGEFFIDGDKIYLFPQKCVVSWGQCARNVPSKLVTHGVGIPKQPNQPFPSMTLNQSSNVPSALIMCAANIVKHPQSISSMPLSKCIIPNKSATNLASALIMPDAKLMKQANNTGPPMTFNHFSDVPSEFISYKPNSIISVNTGKLVNNVPSPLILPGAEDMQHTIPAAILTRHPKSALITSGTNVFRQTNPSKALSQSATNFASPLITKTRIVGQSIPSMLLSQSTNNVLSSLASAEANIVKPIQSTSVTTNCVSIQNPTLLIAANEIEANLSPPEYLKFQKGGYIMYYSNYLYSSSKKRGDKTYYSCHNSLFPATALEIYGYVDVNHLHNHDPPREEYEALVTKKELKKIVADSPTKKSSCVYHHTLNSQLSEVPDLQNTKATPIGKLCPPCTSHNLVDQNSPNDNVTHPIPTLALSQSCNAPLILPMPCGNIVRHSPQPFPSGSSNNVIPNQSPNNFASALILPGTEFVKQSIHPVPTMTFSQFGKSPSVLIIPWTNIVKQALKPNPTMSLHTNTGQSASNVPSELIMSGPNIVRQPTPTMILNKSVTNLQLIMSVLNKVSQPIPTMLISQSVSNVPSSVVSPVVVGVSQSIPSLISDSVSTQDATILNEATNETEASCEASSPIYLKSQNGEIMYHSSYLYTLSRKAQDKRYYKCRDFSCPATALEVNGIVAVKRHHNHDPPREEYEALVTKEKLKKAVAANPTQKLISVYNQTISSRLSEVPDLGNYPKATPRFKSVRGTLKRVTMAKQPRPSCKSKVNIGSQDCSNSLIAQPIPTTTLSQSCNVPLLISSGANIVRPVQSIPFMILSNSIRNVQNSLFFNDGVSTQDAAILNEVTNETEASCEASIPIYLKSQNGETMYYSSYLYTLNKKAPDKRYYKCRNFSCPATALEVNGIVAVKRQHNHNPPREEYEALVTKIKLKKAVVANPTQKLSNVYYETISSRLSEVPDLADYPKAAPPFRSVISTLKRAIKAKQPSPLCRSKVQLGNQSSPQDQIIDPLPKRKKLLN